MPEIKVLPREIAELIAAGEVVERPSAVIKELVENSIDAGASAVTVEIKRGGITYMSVRDNGCGIARKDVPTAFLRHATSKIKQKCDLDAIGTLGFRGEALAAISAVSKTQIITRTADEEIGTCCTVEGGVQTSIDDIGCDIGTIITVRDIFYNTPARMKFLKSDVTEAGSIAAVVDRMALSHPEISFRFIKDGKQMLSTAGDGNISNTVYAVLGRDFAAALIDADNTLENIHVHGKICKPVYCKQNRNGQFFFLNGRLVRSGTACAALEQAYKNSVMTGKFPCCVLFIDLPENTVDVNVHPAKTEVRFSDEKKVFSSVYYAVKNALERLDTRPEIKIKPFNPYTPVAAAAQQMTVDEYKNTVLNKPVDTFKYTDFKENLKLDKADYNRGVSSAQSIAESPKPQLFAGDYKQNTAKVCEPAVTENQTEKTQAESFNDAVQQTRAFESAITDRVLPVPIKYIGQVFDTYIIAQKENEIYLIDKHAAHERILYEQFKNSEEIQVQQLLTPVSVTLTADEYAAIIQNTDSLQKQGFYVEDFGGNTVKVTAVPAMLKDEDISLLVSELAGQAAAHTAVSPQKFDDIFHTVACKAAIKGKCKNDDAELAILAEKILADNNIMYCPHGRPVAFKITRRELEKYFGRIQ